MPKTDLFDAIDALFTKEEVPDWPSFFIMHRFLASDPQFAQIARYLQKDLRGDTPMIVQTWRGMLPTRRGSPRTRYVAPKKRGAESELVRRIMEHTNERRDVVEQMVEIVREAGRLDDLHLQYGTEPE